jgi:hypothetical protein
LNCAKCGKEIQDKESNYCAYCGNPFDPKSKSVDLATEAGILASVAATFSGAVGIIGVLTYQSSVAYYSSMSYDTSSYIGFLLLGILGVISAVFGITGGTLSLLKKRFNISIFGILFVLAAALFSLIVITQYQYGYTDTIILSETSIVVFSILSAILVFKSKSAFHINKPPLESLS